MSNIYKFYSIKCSLNNTKLRYYESSPIEDINKIILKYKLEDKSGKEIQNIINTNGIQYEKLLKLSIIYNDWYLYKTDNIIGTTI